MEIRHAGTEDAALVGELIGRFLAEEGFDTPPDEARSRSSRFLAEPANAAFLAVADDRAIGVATVTSVFNFESGGIAEVEDLYVVPEWRRRGVARALVEAALAWCREHDCRDVEVVITPEGEARHELAGWYRSLGFVDTGRSIFRREV